MRWAEAETSVELEAAAADGIAPAAELALAILLAGGDIRPAWNAYSQHTERKSQGQIEEMRGSAIE